MDGILVSCVTLKTKNYIQFVVILSKFEVFAKGIHSNYNDANN